MCACICVYVHTVGIPGTKAYKGGWLVNGVFQWKVSRVSDLSPSRSHSLHHLPSSRPALLSETSLAAHVRSSLRFPEIKKQNPFIFYHNDIFILWKLSQAVTLTLDAMALSLPSREGFEYTISSSMSPSFSPSITAQLSAPGISHSLLADITKREYLYSNLAERQVKESRRKKRKNDVVHMNIDKNWCDKGRVGGGRGLNNTRLEERKR